MVSSKLAATTPTPLQRSNSLEIVKGENINYDGDGYLSELPSSMEVESTPKNILSGL
jgi:hypothetical protein